jgi:hypothetical protein
MAARVHHDARRHGGLAAGGARAVKKLSMNVLLWILQAALAFLYFAGGYFKAFKFDELASQFTALSRGALSAPSSVGRGPADRTGSHEIDAGHDAGRRRRARAGKA